MKQLRHFISIIILWSISAMAYADVTALTATIDKNPVMADESFTLVVRAEGDADRNAFDSSPLLKDFVVGRTSISSQTSMVNFKTSKSITWTTILIPRKPGQFTIPSFTIDGKSTQPISLLVTQVSNVTAQKGRDLYITTEVDANEAYLQQQIKYTVRLHLARDLQRGSLEAPKLENADIRQIGKDNEFSEIINGRRYRIIERVFAIIPQKSGQFEINGPVFEGEVLDNTRQSFGFFNRTESVSRVGPAQTINVLPIPADYQDHWLPSEFVQLNEEWQPGDMSFTVGEPITRTITLTAVGLVEEQLPTIPGVYPDSLKTYPDQANTATVERDNTLIAQRVESIAIIPGQAGEVTLPEITIPWFNVVTKQTELARLPARTVTVAPATQQNPTLALPEVAQPLASDELTDAADITDTSITATELPSWWSISSWVFLGLWLLTLAAWALTYKKRPSKPAISGETSNQNEKEAWSNLNKALKSHDVQSITPALASWLAVYLGKTEQPLHVSQRMISSTELNRAVSNMFKNRYSVESGNWKSDELLQVLKAIRQQSGEKEASNGGLSSSLYPQY